MAKVPSKTFFSYAREDSEFVLRLVKDLRAAGATVWLDQLDILGGLHWDTEIEKALRECPSQVIVLSPAAVSSANVMDEVSFALEERKQVIPILYRDCQIPFRLRRVQYIDFREEYGSGVRALLKALSVAPQPASSQIPKSRVEPSVATVTGAVPLGPAAQPAQAAEHDPKHVEAAPAKPPVQEPLAHREPAPAAVLKPRPVHLEVVAAPAPVPTKNHWPAVALGAIVLVVVSLILWHVAANHGENKQSVQATRTPEPANLANRPTIAPTPAPTPGTDPDSMAEASYTRGMNYLERKKYKEAIDAFTQAIVLRPNYVDAYVGRGRAYAYRGQYDSAIEEFDRALKLDPNSAYAYSNRGLAYDGKKQFDRAIEDYDQALRIDPKYGAAYYNRGLAYYNKGQYDRAIQDYDQALKIDPNDTDAYYNRGLAYHKKGQNGPAIQDYNQAVKINPNSADTYVGRGNAYDDNGQHDRAIQDYSEALKIDPNNALAYNNRGLTYEEKGNQSSGAEQKGYYRQAIQDFDSALKLKPNYAEAQENHNEVAAKLAKLRD